MEDNLFKWEWISLLTNWHGNICIPSHMRYGVGVGGGRGGGGVEGAVLFFATDNDRIEIDSVPGERERERERERRTILQHHSRTMNHFHASSPMIGTR